MSGGISNLLPAALPVAVLGALLIAAAVSDLRERTISNNLNLGVMLVAPVLWLTSGVDVQSELPWQLATAGLVFAAAVVHFYIGGIGGGDVKLFGALALSFEPQWVIPWLWAMALTGAALSTVMLIHFYWRKPPSKPELPYGLAITCGAIWVLPQQYINHLPFIPTT